MEEEILEEPTEESIKEYKLEDAVMLRDYYINIINSEEENTRDRNEAAKNLARLQHLLQAEKEVADKYTAKQKEMELTEEEQDIIKSLIKYGERIKDGNDKSSDTRTTENPDDEFCQDVI